MRWRETTSTRGKFKKALNVVVYKGIIKNLRTRHLSKSLYYLCQVIMQSTVSQGLTNNGITTSIAKSPAHQSEQVSPTTARLPHNRFSPGKNDPHLIFIRGVFLSWKRSNNSCHSSFFFLALFFSYLILFCSFLFLFSLLLYNLVKSKNILKYEVGGE